MPNMRVIASNALDRAVSLTASDVATNYPASYLLNDKKSNTWRTNAGVTSASLRAVWSAAELLSCVVFPFCDFSPTATGRVRVTNEQPATNLMLQSEQLTTAPWAKGATYFSNLNATTAPDGTLTAETYGPTNGSTSFSVDVPTQSVTLAAGSYTISQFIKPIGTATSVRLSHKGTGGATLEANVTLSGSPTCTPSIVGATDFTGTVSGGVSAAPNGFYRIWITFTVAAGGTTLQHRAFPYVGGAALTGNGTAGLSVWGVQLEAGALSSYYPTTTASAIRPLGYIDSWQSYSLDTGTVLLCPAPTAPLQGFTTAQAALAYAYGGGACARAWFTPTPGLGMCVDINDANNTQGFLDVVKVITGAYWTPKYNAEYGVTMGRKDNSVHYETEAGDLLTDRRPSRSTMQFSLSAMDPTDRTNFMPMVRNSRAYPIFVSMFPGALDNDIPALNMERDHAICGKLVQDLTLTYKNVNAHSTTVNLNSI